MKIWAHTIVHNEENFIWFSIMSVVDDVDKVLVWDTGSTDQTVEIIKEIKRIEKNKIIFKEVGPVDKDKFTKMRQAMLDQSICDWILILDGDEIWWQDSIKKLVKEINDRTEKIDGIVVPMVVPVGDIYHFQEEAAGKYHLLGRMGHFSLRAINKEIAGLHLDWPYGKESYFDGNNKLVQERPGVVFLNAPYLHVTHLKRSSYQKRTNKFKYEWGLAHPKDFKYPEVLYKTYPKIVPSPWVKPTKIDKLRMIVETPLRRFKRKIF